MHIRIYRVTYTTIDGDTVQNTHRTCRDAYADAANGNNAVYTTALIPIPRDTDWQEMAPPRY